MAAHCFQKYSSLVGVLLDSFGVGHGHVFVFMIIAGGMTAFFWLSTSIFRNAINDVLTYRIYDPSFTV